MKRLVAVIGAIAISLSVYAQEFGRAPLSTGGSAKEGLGRASLPPARYDGFLTGGTWGMKLALGWASADWDIGPAGGSDSVFAPQVSLFYKTTDNLDVNFSMLFVSAEDEDDELGNTEGDMTRLAVGVRYWVNTQSRVTPYFGCGIGYYLTDGDTDSARDENGQVVPADVSDIEDTPGAFLEAGAAFQVGDNVFLTTDLSYDFLLGSADATINGDQEDFDAKSLAFNLGVAWMF